MSINPPILNLIHNEDQQVCIIEASVVDPTPYDICLNSLSIFKSNSFIRVSVLTNFLQIEGEVEKLEILASWFDFDDDT